MKKILNMLLCNLLQFKSKTSGGTYLNYDKIQGGVMQDLEANHLIDHLVNLQPQQKEGPEATVTRLKRL